MTPILTHRKQRNWTTHCGTRKRRKKLRFWESSEVFRRNFSSEKKSVSLYKFLSVSRTVRGFPGNSRNFPIGIVTEPTGRSHNFYISLNSALYIDSIRLCRFLKFGFCEKSKILRTGGQKNLKNQNPQN